MAARSVKSQVVSLYRQLSRDIPKIIVMYGLEMSAREARSLLLLRFRSSAAGATDPRIVSLLLDRAHREVEEVMNQWKQRGHIEDFLKPDAASADPWYDDDEFSRRCVARRAPRAGAPRRGPPLAAPPPLTDARAPRRAPRRFLEGTLDENVVWANWSPAAQRERVARLRAMEAAQGATPPGGAEVDAMLASLAAPPQARSLV